MEGASGVSQVISPSRKYGDEKIPVVTAKPIDDPSVADPTPCASDHAIFYFSRAACRQEIIASANNPAAPAPLDAGGGGGASVGAGEKARGGGA
jgi:hypothetical protein